MTIEILVIVSAIILLINAACVLIGLRNADIAKDYAAQARIYYKDILSVERDRIKSNEHLRETILEDIAQKEKLQQDIRMMYDEINAMESDPWDEEDDPDGGMGK